MLIDTTKNYVIKGKPSFLHEELGKKGLSLYPGTSYTVSPIFDDKLKKYARCESIVFVQCTLLYHRRVLVHCYGL